MTTYVNTSPNMNLPVPVPTQDPGPDWAQQLYNCLYSVTDQHNHAAGNGVPITPSGLNIDSDLSFIYNNAINLRSVRFTAQGSPISGAPDIGCIYVSGVDLYYNDLNANPIMITMGGKVNATSSGIGSGTATASFVAGVLVVDEATNTPGNIKAGSILIGNNTAGSNFVTLEAPSALASSYNVVLPTLPSSQSFMTIDSSGNEAAPIAFSGGITSSNIASATITGSNIAATTITKSNLSTSILGQATTLQTSPVTVTGSTPTYVNTGLSFTSTGRPLQVLITSDNGYNNGASYIGLAQTGPTSQNGYLVQGRIELVVDGSPTAFWDLGVAGVSNTSAQMVGKFPVNFSFLVTGLSSGSHNITVSAYALSNGSIPVSQTQIIANGLQLVCYEPD